MTKLLLIMVIIIISFMAKYSSFNKKGQDRHGYKKISWNYYF